jgi:hypothetical protein
LNLLPNFGLRRLQLFDSGLESGLFGAGALLL